MRKINPIFAEEIKKIMKVNLYFGESTEKVIYLDNQKPLDQVTEIKLLFDKGEDFNIQTYSPYVIEAVDAYAEKFKVGVHYFNNGKKLIL